MTLGPVDDGGPEIAASTAARIVNDPAGAEETSRACAIRDVDHGQRAL
jgi:hypothetical protein